MGRTLILTSLLAALALAAPAGAAAAPRHHACEHRGVTVDRSAKARLFEVDRDGDRTLYGCWRANGRLQALASWFSCDCSVGDDTAPDAELHAARFAEVTEFVSCGPNPDPACGGSTTTLRDLKRRRSFPADGDVTDVVVATGHGWAFADGRAVAVRGARAQVLDPGPGVEAGSLAFAWPRLYWMRGGEPRSALVQ
jgi:hypothetical protein